jgi:PTH1 family peptidyl-tRNA hydrolase
MLLVAGLGNPGQQYEKTRHNVGFMFMDHLARTAGIIFSESKWKGYTARTVFGQEAALLLKPMTFMNLSGTSVALAANFYKLAADKIIVIHDDLDMALGRVKIVAGGGDGGHRGIRSIIECLGTRDFPRLKIGIGRPPRSIPAERYVLGRFASEELEMINARMTAMVDGINIFAEQGIAAAMNKINQKE